MRRMLILILVVWLAGCAAPTPRVERMVAPCPEPPAAVRPYLPVSGLTDASTPDEVMRAMIATIALLQGYAVELEAVLDGYRARPAGPAGAAPGRR